MAAVAACLAASTVPVGAQSLSDARNRLRSLRQSFGRATDVYVGARDRWETTKWRLDSTRAELALTRRRLAKAQRLLNKRMSRLYRTPDFGYVEVVLGSVDFNDFVSGMDFLARIGNADAGLVRQLKRLKAKMKAQTASLRGLEVEQRSRASELGTKATALRITLAAQRENYSRLKRAALMEAKARSSGAGNISLSRGFAFPVDGPHSYSDTWGAPRSGGRTHKGTDIFADFGTPVVAVCSGSVDAHSGGLGGLAIWLSGSDGNSYYYAHLQGFEVSGGSVSAGQIIGRVGDTGNAQGGAPHLHFEIHPGGGSAIDPYPILAASD